MVIQNACYKNQTSLYNPAEIQWSHEHSNYYDKVEIKDKADTNVLTLL